MLAPIQIGPGIGTFIHNVNRFRSCATFSGYVYSCSIISGLTNKTAIFNPFNKQPVRALRIGFRHLITHYFAHPTTLLFQRLISESYLLASPSRREILKLAYRECRLNICRSPTRPSVMGANPDVSQPKSLRFPSPFTSIKNRDPFLITVI